MLLWLLFAVGLLRGLWALTGLRRPRESAEKLNLDVGLVHGLGALAGFRRPEIDLDATGLLHGLAALAGFRGPWNSDRLDTDVGLLNGLLHGLGALAGFRRPWNSDKALLGPDLTGLEGPPGSEVELSRRTGFVGSAEGPPRPWFLSGLWLLTGLFRLEGARPELDSTLSGGLLCTELDSEAVQRSADAVRSTLRRKDEEQEGTESSESSSEMSSTFCTRLAT